MLFNSRLKPSEGVTISDGAREIHGISDEDVADAPTWADVYEQVAEIINGKTLVIYNAGFDTGILFEMSDVYNLPQLQPKRVICAMLEFSQWYGSWSEYHQSYTWQPLYGGDHTALGDCLATLDVIKTMAKSVEP